MADAIHAALGGGEARRALAAFHAIAAEDRDSGAFVRHALDRLAELVGSDLTTLSICDLERQTRTVVSRRGEALSANDRAAFDRHFRDHPLVRYHSTHPQGPTQRITDCVSLSAFRQSPVFADYYRGLGIGHVMALPLRIDDATVVSVVFNRSRSNFADAERALVDVLRRPLATLHRGILAREEARLGQASLEGIAARAGWHRARVTAAGQLADVSAATAQVLRHFFGAAPARGHGEPPAALQAWLRRRSVNWGLDRLLPGAGEPYVVARGGSRLTIHFIADPLMPERGELLMLQEHGAPAADELRSLPITRREREVLAILAAGKTNADIAALLSISPRTVQKHLEHVYEKLGVETRTAAALRAAAAALRGGDGS
ncbi:MAG TPA: LuxR C-terminal-related transcriptional regulator [Stellaceae bacterium]|nr:LuxR C-terminal-related transcriptional regulator [Stellaceae bacterium]